MVFGLGVLENAVRFWCFAVPYNISPLPRALAVLVGTIDNL